MESTDNPNGLRLVGGHLALDLVNTVEPRVPGAAPERDHLTTPAELLAWAIRAGALEAAEAAEVRRAWRGGEQALAAALAVRESLYAALVGRSPSAALEQLATRYAAAAARARLTRTPDGDSPAAIRFGDAAEFAIQDRLAAAAIDLITTVDAAQLRTCPLEEGGCGWVFLDRSRNHSRRWCAMADCGSRVKAQRLTGRRRAAAR